MSADRKGRKRCPRCGYKRLLEDGRCYPCRQLVSGVKRQMHRADLPKLLEKLRGMGIEAEAVETSPGNFVVRRKSERQEHRGPEEGAGDGERGDGSVPHGDAVPESAAVLMSWKEVVIHITWAALIFGCCAVCAGATP